MAIYEDHIKHFVVIIITFTMTARIVVTVVVFSSLFHESTTSLDMANQHLDRNFLKSWHKSHLQALYIFTPVVDLFSEVMVYRVI